MFRDPVGCGQCQPGQEALSCVRKQAEQVVEKKLVSSVSPLSLLDYLPLVLDFLLWLSSKVSYDVKIYTK